MTLQFPIPQFVGQAVTFNGQVWVWDSVAWVLDDVASRLDLATVPAYEGQFVYRVGGALPVLFISLATPDLFGATYVLATSPPYEGVKVYRNGELLILDNGAGSLGDYVVNRAANRIDFIDPLPVGTEITIGILTPSDSLAPGRVDVVPIKDLSIDWSAVPPVGGLVDGVRTQFSLYWDRPGVGQQAAVISSNEALAVVVDGNRQQPGVDYTVTGSALTMTVAPQPGKAFWALWYRPGGAGGGGAGVEPPQPPQDAQSRYYGWVPGTGLSWADARGVAVTVADAAARAALRAEIDKITGKLVLQADTADLYLAGPGTAWARYLDGGSIDARGPGRVQVLRGTTALQRPAAGSLLPGEIYVNLADREIGVGGLGGNPTDLIQRIVSSAGADDAGKIPGLGGTGLLDSSFFVPGLRPYGSINPGSIEISNWNDAHLNGTTVVRAPAGTLNRPPGADLPYAGTYISMGNADTGVLTAMSPQGDTVFIRPRSGGSWGAWIQVNSPGLDISSAMLRVNNLNDVNSKPAGRTNLEVLFNPRALYAGDLNALDETGLYPLAIGVTNGWTNDGTGAGGEATVGDAVLHIETGGSLAYQMGFNVLPTGPAAKPLRMRFMVGPTTWTPWVAIQTSDEVAAAITAAVNAAIAALPPSTAHIGPTAPPTPVEGQFWYNTTAQGLFVFRTDTDPDRWEQAWPDPPDPPPATHVGDTPPTSPAQGQLWFKTVAPVGLFVWYEDGDSSQWVQIGGGGPAFATTAEARAGSRNDVVMSPEGTKEAIGVWAIGVGQTWKTIPVASRPVDTPHQNTTGRPIMVCTRGRSTTTTARPVQVSADAVTWIEVGNHPASSAPLLTSTMFILPAGHYWRIVGALDSFYGVSELS